MKREIKKSKVTIIQQTKQQGRSRSRSRSRQKEKNITKNIQVESINPNNRRALLQRMRQRQQAQKIQKNIVKQQNEKQKVNNSSSLNEQLKQKKIINQKINQESDGGIEQNSSANSQNSQENNKVLLKPVYVSKDQRDTIKLQEQILQKKYHQQQRKLKINKLNTKLILNETMKAEGQQQNDSDQEDSDKDQLPDDDDTKDQALQYELWRIRQLKRIRRDKQERQKYIMNKAEIERRRKLTDQQRILQNKLLGSDSTDQKQQTKYVFMQKYYHKGAFYQDNDDQIYKRDYNLPTPLELQDKSLLPKILQKRKNDFGKKGQSKYTHLTEEDTTNFDPQFRADETILVGLQRKLGGYKGAFMKK